MEPFQQSPSGITLLIAEDNKDVREIAGLMIARRFPQITIHYAENGRAGVELFKEHPADIVITDISMPVMDGIQMAGEIKTMKADTKVIVLTAHSDRHHSERFGAIGINEYIVKPIMFGTLFAALEQFIAEIMLKRAGSM
jgi:YesN/AraC family two-component response regulator